MDGGVALDVYSSFTNDLLVLVLPQQRTSLKQLQPTSDSTGLTDRSNKVSSVTLSHS